MLGIFVLPAFGSRIKDLTTIAGQRDNQLVGYGLVVGYVQSGKTGHFSGLISRAIDEGFTFIIVLSGILNDLRRQTQLRLHKDVFGMAGVKAHAPLKTITPPSNNVLVDLPVYM